MSPPDARAPLIFAGLGHGLHHILTGLFPTVVLVLVPLWNLPYEELIALWTMGALLLGLGAPAAGWLADRWGEIPLMIAFYLGLGASALACGLSDGPLMLQLGLAAMGLFGAIYHPVGTAWIVKNAMARGRAIAIVGVCGAVGVALASLVAAVLTDLGGWRLAFILPGMLTFSAGMALIWFYATGGVVDRRVDAHPIPDPDPTARRNTAIILVMTMCLTSIVWHAFATMLPKWLSLELASSLGQGLTGLGALVTFVYLVGAIAQFIGGHFADRGSAKQIYVASFVLKLIAFLLALAVTGWPVVAVAAVIALVFDIAAPVENFLIAQYASARRRGLTYGLRHGIAIVSAPLGVQIVSWLYHEGDGFGTLLLALTLITLLILLASLLLPADQSGAAPAAEAPRP
jgi:MFS family permease